MSRDQQQNPPADNTAPDELAAAKAQADEYLAGWKRATADYQNLQKDVARERGEMGQYAVLRVVERILPVLDHFRAAAAHTPTVDDAGVKNWVAGIGLIEKQFEDFMKDLGLVAMQTVGEPFDATRHDAVGEEAAEGKAPGTILKETQAGYTVNGKVVRPAKVIISK